MRILMLGNSFTTANHMPDMLAELTGAEIVQHTRGGERLADQLNPKTKMGKRTQEALQNEKWDFVILQEMSNGLITSKASFLENAEKLCEKIRENGAKPVFYATWAYQRGEKKLETFGMDYDEMYQKLYEAYHLAADRNHTLIADVGKKFYELSDKVNLYADDGCHPNEKGSQIAAEIIAPLKLTQEGEIAIKYAKRIQTLYQNLEQSLGDQKRHITRLSVGITNLPMIDTFLSGKVEICFC